MKELSMHIMDIVQNSVKAEAVRIETEITEDTANNIFSFSVTDNGLGMPQDLADKLGRSYINPNDIRGTGFGIPMLNEICRQCGGELFILSKPGKGTFIEAVMEHNNINRPPLGNIEDSIFLMAVINPGAVINFKYIYNGKSFCLDMDEIYEILGDVPICSPAVLKWLRNHIKDGMQNCIF